MEQSTKLFLVLGVMFIIYTTINGHLEKYLKVMFGNGGTCNSSGGGGSGGGLGGIAKSATDAVNKAVSAGKTVGAVASVFGGVG